jgi:hypothetical protein
MTIAPTPRSGAQIVYDVAHDCMVAFGGLDQDGDQVDTWLLKAGAWVGPVATPVVPTPRFGFALVYDEARAEALLFGGARRPGYGGAIQEVHLSDVWRWNGATWQGPIQPAFAPAGRLSPAVAYDRGRARVVVFGGEPNQGEAPDRDTWEWDGASWRRLTTTPAPKVTEGVAMAYDAERQRTVLHGRRGDPDSPGHVLYETWEWDGTTWVDRSPSTRPAVDRPVLVYQASRKRVLMFGSGKDSTEMWEWDGLNWSFVPTGAIARLPTAAVTFDPSRATILCFGGFEPGAGRDRYSNAIWEWDGTTWRYPARNDGPLYLQGVARHPLTGAIVALGSVGPAVGARELWSFDGFAWHGPEALPEAFTPRWGAALTNDLARKRLVVFGGEVAGPLPGEAFIVDELWEWDGTTWKGPIATEGPGRRSHHTVVYATAEHGALSFGGITLSALPFEPNGDQNDTWLWDGASWSQSSSPTRRCWRHCSWWHSLACDEGGVLVPKRRVHS